MQDNRFKRETFAESSNHSFNNTAWNIVLRRTKDWYPDHDYNKLLERSENRHQYEEGFIRGSIFAESLMDLFDEGKLPQNHFEWSYRIDGGFYNKYDFKKSVLEKIDKELLPYFRTSYVNYLVFDWGIIVCYDSWIKYYLFDTSYHSMKYLTHYLPELLQSCLNVTPKEKTPDFPTFYLVTKELKQACCIFFYTQEGISVQTRTL